MGRCRSRYIADVSSLEDSKAGIMGIPAIYAGRWIMNFIGHVRAAWAVMKANRSYVER
jgi:hypothetical protein